MEVKDIFILSSKETLRKSSIIGGLAIRHGFNATLKCDDEEYCHKAIDIINSDLEARITAGEIQKESKTSILNHLKITTDSNVAKNCNLAVESVIEDENIKCKALKKLEDICAPETILITDTSTITITKLAGATRKPQNVIGMHIINFGPVLKMAEIVRGMYTSEKALNIAEKLAKDLGLETVYPKDVPGLLTSRSWLMYINETANCVYNGMGTAQNFAFQFQLMGAKGAISPLESADYIGIDNCVVMLNNLYKAYADPKFSPSPLLLRMVDARQLGWRSGKGFFTSNTGRS